LKNVSCRFHDAADAIADSARRRQNSPEGDPMNVRLRACCFGLVMELQR
jgi:hypothetical protein